MGITDSRLDAQDLGKEIMNVSSRSLCPGQLLQGIGRLRGDVFTLGLFHVTSVEFDRFLLNQTGSQNKKIFCILFT